MTVIDTGMDGAPAGLIRRPALAIALIVGLAAVVRLVFATGITGADDLSIGGIALRFFEDGYTTPTSHYPARWGLIWPQSLLLGWFGVGDWQMGLVPFLCSVANVALAYGIGRQLADVRTGLLAALLLTFFPLDIGLSSTLFPDLPLGTFCALAIYLALVSGNSGRSWLWALLAGLCWGYGYLIKIEAFFLLFPMLALYVCRHIGFMQLLAVGVGCAVFVVGENIVYLIDTGHLLHRLKVMANTGLHVEASQGGGELWVFPKAWFITFYQFSLYYYALFAGLAWLFVAGRRDLYVPGVWAIAFLVWLQFGFNPLAEVIAVKSHLARYCTMISVPMAIIVAALLLAVGRRFGNAVCTVGVAGLVLVSLFLTNFNLLSAEREVATKRGLDYVVANDLFPLYLDQGSYAIATFILRGTPHADRLHSLQDHDFATGQTTVVDAETVQGYVLINTEFERHRAQRYGMKNFDIAALGARAAPLLSIDNPLNGLAYQQARWLQGLGSLIPVPALSSKIADTAGHLLRGNDVAIYRVQPVTSQ